uniref:RING-type E3 ubiquitin transferase n=1 Tax=Haemonchus contortus TaxID=6289 RepID=A0A7I4Y375_HAECO|nr:Protein C52E12.1 [Haemonchus contortus]
MSKMPVPDGSNPKKPYFKNRNNQPKRNPNNAGGTTTRESAPRNSQLSREERGQNLQYRNINMQKYELMLGSAKDNFADIPQGSGPVEECTICCKMSDVFGMGTCRHPICIECAIRMRVLSKSSQCPVCRANMETLWLMFVAAGLDTVCLSFPSLNHPDEKRFSIQFQNADILSRYEKYLSHVCKLCKSDDGGRLEFPTFVALRHHMSNAHELIYCHICTENIILFSRERKTYTRDNLQRHIRTGDRDDKSLKGHPSCLFCDQRFFDEEFRYRHLRKEHFFCQFCETEGKHLNVFFGNHKELLQHYKEKHFLCEFEECRAMGIAFSNQMDLNLHKSKEHSGRRAPVAIDFQFNDRQLAGPSRSRREGLPPVPSAPLARRDKIAVVKQEPPAQVKRPTEEFIVVPSAQRRPQTVRYSVAPAFTVQTQDFPSLGNSTSDPALNNLRPDNFPRLNRVNHPGGAPSSVANATRSPPTTTPTSGAPSSSGVARKAPTSVQPSDRRQDVEDFPALPTAPKQNQGKSVWAAKKNSKSVIVGCKMPNGTKTLPQPDIWPDISVSTPAREIEPEQWHEVPAKPQKVDKKVRKAQQKATKLDDSSRSDETQGKHPAPSDSAAADEKSVPSDFNMVKITGNWPSVKTKKKKNAVNDAPPMEKQDSKMNQPTEVRKELVTEASAEDERLAEVEKYVEDSVNKPSPDETTSQTSSILNWFTSSSSSIFSNLSLANVMGTKSEDKSRDSNSRPDTSSDTTPPPLQTQPAKAPERRIVLDDAAPPGFNIEPSLANNLLAGPPPGFENTHLDDAPPPGLSLPSTSQPVFSMAPFISQSDIDKNSNVPAEKRVEESGWMKVGGK